MKYILGKKLEMTEVWKGEEVVAVTKVAAGPCRVVQVKNEDKDKYCAVQLSFGSRKEKNIKKPQKGHMKDLGNFMYLREFRTETENLQPGGMIDVTTFEEGDKVQATGISKGKGFQGVVKRHGFHGQDKTHGNKDQLRMPGSVGATGPAHVFKGLRMPGRMGGDRVTVKNLEIIEVDKENNILFIKGAIPGARNGLVLISGEGDLKVTPMATNDQPMATKKGETDEAGEKKESKAKEKIEDKKAETPAEVEKEVVEAKEKVDKETENKK